MKKILSLFLISVFVFGVFLPNNLPTKAQNLSTETPDCKTCSLKDLYSEEELKKELNDSGVTIEDTNKEDKKTVKKLIKDKSILDKEITKELEKGFKALNNSEMFITFKNTNLGGYDYDKAIVYATLLKNKNNDLLVISAWVDGTKNELIKYEIGTITNDNPEKYNSLLSYEKSKANGDFSASGFKWNGQSFACSMTGVFACITYCGVVGLACGPGAAACGTVCDLVCGAAFAYACS